MVHPIGIGSLDPKHSPLKKKDAYCRGQYFFLFNKNVPFLCGKHGQLFNLLGVFPGFYYNKYLFTNNTPWWPWIFDILKQIRVFTKLMRDITRFLLDYSIYSGKWMCTRCTCIYCIWTWSFICGISVFCGKSLCNIIPSSVIPSTSGWTWKSWRFVTMVYHCKTSGQLTQVSFRDISGFAIITWNLETTLKILEKPCITKGQYLSIYLSIFRGPIFSLVTFGDYGGPRI